MHACNHSVRLALWAHALRHAEHWRSVYAAQNTCNPQAHLASQPPGAPEGLKDDELIHAVHKLWPEVLADLCTRERKGSAGLDILVGTL